MLSFPNSLYRLGLLCGTYRLITIVSLLLAFLVGSIRLKLPGNPVGTVFILLLIYLFFAMMQIVAYASSPKQDRSKHLIVSGFIDVFCFTALLTFSSAQYYIGTMFAISLFLLNLTMPVRYGLIASALAVIGSLGPLIVSGTKGQVSITFTLMLTVTFLAAVIVSQWVVRQFNVFRRIQIEQQHLIDFTHEINNHMIEYMTLGFIAFDSNLKPVLINPLACHYLDIPQKQPATIYEKHGGLINQIRQRCASNSSQSPQKEIIFDYQYQGDTLLAKLTHIELSQPWIIVTLENMALINQRIQSLKLAELGQLSASIAHEIRNPLSIIVQSNDLILGSDPTQQATLNKIISTQSSRIDQIIISTLALAKNKQTMRVRLDLNFLLNDMLINEFIAISDQIGIQIASSHIVLFDPIQLRQVIHNLVQNAHRHNNPSVSKKIHIKVTQQASLVHIEVIDYGDGVSNMTNLFKPFHSTAVNGTGLGLYLSKTMCEANHAKISYDKLVSGACFRITLDAAPLEQLTNEKALPHA